MDDKVKLFQEIKLLVIEWYNESQPYFKNNFVSTNILCNEKDGFVVSFDNDTAMAELIVEQASYAPYRFVSFEIAIIEDDQAKISYSWYDNESSSKKEIKKQLIKGVTVLLQSLKLKNNISLK